MIRSRNLIVMPVMLLVASMALTACGPKQAAPSQPATQPGATSGTPAVGGELNLRLPKDPDSLNPILSASAYGSQVHSLVYATLFEFNEKFEPTPYLADTWKASDDGLTWTIKLKHGVKFHDGNELTADDVVFTLKSIMDPAYTGPRSASVSSVKDVTAPDKYTVQAVLTEAHAPILQDINYGILEKQLFANTPVKDMDKSPVNFKPVGAGPYKFVEYKRGQYVMLERNDNWFMSAKNGGAPFIKSIRYKIIPDESSAQAALENGEIDVLEPEPKEVTRLQKEFAGKLTAYDYERNGWGYISFNVTRPHLNNKLVRQALTYGLDRQSIINGVMDGRAVIPAGPISSVSWAYDPSIKPFPYDPAKAKQLLEQAGYKMGASGIYEKDGQPLKLGFYASSGSPLIEGIAAIAKQDWKQIGVDVDVQLIDYNAMMDNFLKPGKFDVSFAGMSLGLDPDQTSLFHSSQVTGFNKGRYSNPQVDKLLEQGVHETDQSKRKAIYAEYQKQLVDDAPVIFVYANKYSNFVSSKFQGVVNFPGAGTDFSYIYRWHSFK